MPWNTTPAERREFIKFPNEDLDESTSRHFNFQTRSSNGADWVRLTRDEAQQNLRHFRNVIHKQLRRYGFPKRAPLRCVPVFEGTDIVRTHVHLMLDRPDCIQSDEYAKIIQREWQRTFWGHRLVTVELCHDNDGWLFYISKLQPRKTSQTHRLDKL